MYDNEYQAKKTFVRNPVTSDGPLQFLKSCLSIDSRSLALFRILLGFTVMYDVWDRFSDLTIFYTDSGILDRSRVLEIAWNPYWNSIYMMTGTWYGEAILFSINFVAGLCLMIGYYTKIANVMCWAFFLSFIARNNYVGHSGDVYMRIILLFANFLPLGEFYSVDDFLNSLKGQETSNSRSQPPKQILSSATICIVSQIIFMYVFSTYYKTGTPWTRDFTAAWMALQLDWFRLPLGDFFLGFPLFLRFLTWATFYWERFGPLFLFSPFYYGPLRTFGAFGFIGMHLGFAWCLRLDSFFWITAGTLTTLIPSWFWDTLFGFMKSPRHQISIHIHSNIPRLVDFVRCFAYFFLFPEAEVTTRSTASPLTVKHSSEDVRRIFLSDGAQQSVPEKSVTFNLMVLEKTGTTHFDLDALILIFRSSPIFWPISTLADNSSFVKGLIEKLYNFLISGDREIEEEFEGDIIEGDESIPKKKVVRRHFVNRRKREGLIMFIIQYSWWILWNLFLLYLLLLIFQWNMTDAGFKGWRVSNEQRPIIWTFGLDQSWRMFAPHPPTSVFYHVIEGDLKNGEKVELFGNGAIYTWEPNRSPNGISFEKPDPLTPCYKNHRGFKYWENGFNTYPQNDKVRLDMGRYICREYNARHKGDQRLVGHKIWIVWEHVKVESDKRTKSKPELLWNHQC